VFDRVPHLARRLYAVEPDIVFLTHPRDMDDVYATLPFFRKVTRLIPERLALRLLAWSPCFVVATIRGPHGIQGMVVSTSLLPAQLVGERTRALDNARRITQFVKRVSGRPVCIGLAAWWPIVTDGGKAFDRWIPAGSRITVTSGHAATLASLYLSTRKIASLSGRSLRELRVLIVGVGKMGGAVAEFLAGRVAAIGLLDKSPGRLQAVAGRVAQHGDTPIERIPVSDNDSLVIREALTQYDVAICTTSNLGHLVADFTTLENCVVLDDARPEAFPRGFSAARRAVVLEGGLMRIPGVTLDSDFGFGSVENVFGCLAEAYLLALDKGRSLAPTRGDVHPADVERLMEFCQAHGITEGDFKSGARPVSPAELAHLMDHGTTARVPIER
jgi:predicted amino acid dehydrogenase